MASITHGNDIFELTAERVALTSFRSTLAGYDLGDPSCWDDLWSTLVSEGGVDLACRISGSLHYFVRTLRAARPQKINYFPVSCKRACTDECLMLSLLSACQHGTAETLDFCLKTLLSAEDGQRHLYKAAEMLSKELKAAGLTLLPVPMDVIKSLVPATCHHCAAAKGCGKIH
jgi:hypothetical protein